MSNHSKKIIIVGFGSLAKTLYCYLLRDGFEVESFLVDNEYLVSSSEFSINSIDRINEYDKEKYLFIVAIAHVQMNSIRAKLINKLLSEGYNLINYISPKSITYGAKVLGSNNIIMDSVIIAPNATIYDGNLFWPSSVISHDVRISSFSTFASGSKIAGKVSIGNNCFFGLNSSVNENLIVSDFTLVGANVNISKATVAFGVYVNSRFIKLKKSSQEFFK
jgi:sugar O-acyltransferase (sialic acid O-acetyltransferase NeuD family)